MRNRKRRRVLWTSVPISFNTNNFVNLTLPANEKYHKEYEMLIFIKYLHEKQNKYCVASLIGYLAT